MIINATAPYGIRFPIRSASLLVLHYQVPQTGHRYEVLACCRALGSVSRARDAGVGRDVAHGSRPEQTHGELCGAGGQRRVLHGGSDRGVHRGHHRRAARL